MKTRSNVMTYLMLAVMFLLLRDPFHHFWNGLGGIELLNHITPSKWNDLAALMLIVLGVPGMVGIARKLSATGRRWARAIAGCILYILIIQRICYGDSFISFETLPWLRYSDILIPIFVALWIAACEYGSNEGIKSDPEQMPEAQLLVDDNHEIDFMGRTRLVNDICEQLRNYQGNENGALGLAITGGWGTGKTWIMTHLQEKLEESKQICVEFKPWLYGETNITRQFYLTLERQLAIQGIQIGEIKSAVTEIDNDATVGMGRAFLSLVGIITKSVGREAAVENIKERLKEFGRLIYVFIDDCDRLAHDELIQVLSLIRNTGDFPHLTYIMSFSNEMVSKTIEKEEGMQYVAKMFNLTYALPPITDAVIEDFLHQAVCKMTESEPEKTENAFKRVKITDYLDTVREAKKYFNLLATDYHSYKERFETYYIRFGDFCLLELLKYCFADTYFNLRSSVESYLESKYEGWNSPAFVVKNSVVLDEKARHLLNEIFSIEKDPREFDHVIGASNSEYTPLYFTSETSRKYIVAKEVDDALEKGDFSKRIPRYVSNGLSGVMGMLSAVYSFMSRREVFESMIAYIWSICENDHSSNSFSLISNGYHSEQWKHSYKRIRKLMRVTPQIQLITFQRLSNFDDAAEEDEGDSMDDLIQNTPHLIELMAIWLEELKDVGNSDYPYGEVDYYIKEIWERLLRELKDEPLDTLNMIEILGDCSQEDTFEKKVLPLVTTNPKRWLGATVKLVKEGGKKYYVLKSRETHSLFGCQDKMVDELRAIKDAVSVEDKEYVEAYDHLAKKLAAIILYKDDPSIDEKYKDVECIQVSEFPDLAESQFVGTEIFQPIGDAITQLAGKALWTGINLRTQRKDPDYYFGTEI